LEAGGWKRAADGGIEHLIYTGLIAADYTPSIWTHESRAAEN